MADAQIENNHSACMPLRNFLLFHPLSTARASLELASCPFWDWLGIRRMFPGSQHTGIHDIILRFAPLDRPSTFESLMDGTANVDYFPCWGLPETVALVRLAAGNIGDHFGRIMVTRLDPSSQIGEHIDQGLYAESHDRFHVVVDGGDGRTLFHCGGETLPLQTGMFFKFNHQLRHSVHNAGFQPRTNLIFDVRRSTPHADDPLRSRTS